MAVRRVGRSMEHMAPGGRVVVAVEETSRCPGMLRHCVMVREPHRPTRVRLVGLVAQDDSEERARSWERCRGLAKRVAEGYEPDQGPAWAPLMIRCEPCRGDGCEEDPEVPGVGRRCEPCRGTGQRYHVA